MRTVADSMRIPPSALPWIPLLPLLVGAKLGTRLLCNWKFRAVELLYNMFGFRGCSPVHVLRVPMCINCHGTYYVVSLLVWLLLLLLCCRLGQKFNMRQTPLPHARHQCSAALCVFIQKYRPAAQHYLQNTAALPYALNKYNEVPQQDVKCHGTSQRATAVLRRTTTVIDKYHGLSTYYNNTTP